MALIGDRRQLASIAGAGALRAVAEVVERSAVLEGVRRQQVEWQRFASVVMAHGDAEGGLRAYASHDRVELISGEENAQARVIELWREQRGIHGDCVLIVTRRNRDAAALNALARKALREECRLGSDVIDLPTLDRTDKSVLLAVAVGDWLRFGETLPKRRLRNGSCGTVEAITPQENGEVSGRLSLDDGQRLDALWSALTREPRFGRKASPPRVVHAYAGTAYSVQGRTAEPPCFTSHNVPTRARFTLR